MNCKLTLTPAGQAAIAAAIASGTRVIFAAVVLFDDAANLSPAAEKWRAEPEVSATGTADILLSVVVPPQVGGWYARAIGVLDDDGVLLASANFPESYKPLATADDTAAQWNLDLVLTVGSENKPAIFAPSLSEQLQQIVDAAVTGAGDDEELAAKLDKEIADRAKGDKYIVDLFAAQAEALSGAVDKNLKQDQLIAALTVGVENRYDKGQIDALLSHLKTEDITFSSGATITSTADAGVVSMMVNASVVQFTGELKASRFTGAITFKNFPQSMMIATGVGGAAVPMPLPYSKVETDTKIAAETTRAQTAESELRSQIDEIVAAGGGAATTLAEYGATLRPLPNAATANAAELANQCAATPLAPASIVAGGVIGNGNVSVAYLRTSFGTGTGVVPDVDGVRDDEKGWFYSNQNAAAWGTAGSKAGTASDAHYYQFTLNAGVGKKVTLTGVAYEWQCAVSDTETNPGTFYTGVYASTNGGASFARLAPDTASPALPAKGGFMPAAIAVSLPAQLDAAEIIVRICFAGGTSVGGHAHFWRNVRVIGKTTDDTAGTLASLAARIAALEALIANP